MILHRWHEIEHEQLSQTVKRRVIHTTQFTIARLDLAEGAVVPRHHHPAEQVTTVEQGELRFVFDDSDVMVTAGESLEIPSGVWHRVEAVIDSTAFDVFSPRREDWITGDDAYLRG